MRVWRKHPKNGLGSAARMQRAAYAYAVAMVMTGGKHECPSCGGPMPIDGSSEVDRVNGSERDDKGCEVYREGSIVFLCMACNQGRALLQNLGRDWPHVDAYRSHVADASAMVTVPTPCESAEWWENRPTTVARVSRYA